MEYPKTRIDLLPPDAPPAWTWVLPGVPMRATENGGDAEGRGVVAAA